MDIKQALDVVVLGKNLSASEMRDVMRQIMTGNATEAQIGGFLVALRMKGESIEEIAGAVEVMRELVTGVKVSGDGLVDIVGTGGDEQWQRVGHERCENRLVVEQAAPGRQA